MEARTKRVIEIWSTIGGLLMVGLLFAWCSSGSHTDVPKAEKQATISTAANASSETLTSDANAIHTDVKKAESNTASVRKDFNKSVKAARRPVKRDKYEKTRNTPVVIDNRNLDARERNLLTKLRKLY